MEFAKLSAPTLKELFITELESMILSGRLAVGEKLPPERELAESMQVSRAVVNSGIAELARKGFLTVKPRVGVFVGDYRRHGTAETLRAIMTYNGGHLRREEVKSMLETKLVLDRLAAQLAIPKMTNAQQEALRVLLEAIDTARQAGDLQGAVDGAFRFYHELAFISGNTLIPLIYNSFEILVLSLWERYGRKYGPDTVYQGVARLYDAIARRDVDAALRSIEATVGETIRGAREIYSD
ncbi:GntR family transcriptional regulator [Ruminococcaceae bacterium OttesenSCG-928-D13]|nr:GntR family transcriptional regulator [Ruminococcaceae bacterium OttesenSCG-928-D13]